MDMSRPLVLKTLPPDGDGVFRALADTTRQRLLQLLILEELNVSELVEILAQPQSTISRHLRVLKESGLVRDRRHGATVLYSAARVHSATDGEGDADDLQSMMLHWLSVRPVAPVVRERLEHVLHYRASDASAFFNRVGKRWSELRREAFGSAFATEAFVSLLPRDWTVADVGTGTGDLLPVLAANFRRVLAIDPAETMLGCARQRSEEHGAANVSFRLGELADLPIESASCDLALAILVLHHVKSPEAALSELHRVVRPGGCVLIVEQELHENQAFYETMKDLWWGFAPAELAGGLAAAGFEGVRWQRLTTVMESSGAAESPPLFVLTGARAGG
jgi:SAM-dependent methyltransferase